ncbi:MAG TPA: S8 family serine peptidase [Miltoncostaeaceae bacterium]|nr:S8 family serine peptidase [Miltoncostaeaceae bacterium]
MSDSPDQGAPRLPGRGSPRAAAAAWVLTVLALGAAASNAMAAPTSDQVLVRIDPGAAAADRAGVARALDADATAGLAGGWRVYELPQPMSLARARELLADEPAAGAVHLDMRVHPMVVPNDPLYGSQWALPRIGAPGGWDASPGGAPVTVAVIDTGIDTTHPDLAGRLWTNTGEIPGNNVDDDGDGLKDDVHGWNFADDDAQLYSVADNETHGTHVAGTVAAQRDNALGVAGVADNARIMALKFLKPGGGYTSDAMQAIDYAVAHGAKVINASWGGADYSQPLCDTIQLAGDAGVLFVAAAGNDAADNDATGTWPANCPASSLISVAATNSTDGLAAFSNFGAANVDLGAPGESVRSTMPGNGYGYKSGTSMAAPHVSGVAAVLLGQDPGLAPWQVKAAITMGGDAVTAMSAVTSSGRRLSLSGALGVSANGVAPDTGGPDPFSLLSPADGLATSAPSPVFRWSPSADAQSGLAGYTLTLDGTAVATAPAGATSASVAGAVPEGAHLWTVTARDAVGNQRSATPRTLVVDRTGPGAPPLSAPSGGAKVPGPSVTLSWSGAADALTGVSEYRVTVDGVAVRTLPGTARATTVQMTRGAHVWQVQAVDGVGNASPASSRTVTVTGVTPPAASRRMSLGAIPAVRPGGRPVVRVTLARAGRVSFSVRPASTPRRLGSFTRRLAAGPSRVTLPAGLSHRFRAGRTYVMTARGAGTVNSVRFTVTGRPRR